jgi:hypothetical protein
VIDDEIEADLGQRKTQLLGRAVERPFLAGEERAEVDDGNGLGGPGYSLHEHRGPVHAVLEDERSLEFSRLRCAGTFLV